MKTFMLVGDVSDNAGPSNVHRELMEHWPEGDQLLVPIWSNPFLKVATTILSACRCEVLLTTGAGKLGSLATMIARHRGVPVVVLVHGYLPYENEINSLGLSDLVIERWRKVLLDADLVATNSEFHAGCLREAEPEIATRVRWFNLGIEPFSRHVRGEHEGGITVAVSGGTRPIKGNEVVAQAVSLLQGQGRQVDLSVFGRCYSKNQALEEALQKCDGHMMGQVSHEEFVDALSATDVFVMNSRRDSFGLSAIDALRGGRRCCCLATAVSRVYLHSRMGTLSPIAKMPKRSQRKSSGSYRAPMRGVYLRRSILTRLAGMSQHHV